MPSVAALAVIGGTACSFSKSEAGGSGGGKLALVAYSVPKPAYDALTSAFGATAAGKGSAWGSSYGPSGTQSQAVSNGQKVDYVAFSLEPDLTKLVPEFVDAGWNSGPRRARCRIRWS